MLVLAVAAAAILALLPVVAFAAPPHAPTGITAVAGTAEPLVARLTWNASTGSDTVRYSVSAASSAAGPFKVVGSTTTTRYDFVDGLGGAAYYFRVAAVNGADEQSVAAAEPIGPVTAEWVSDPHVPTSQTTNKCASCHVPHQAQDSSLMRGTISTSLPVQAATCLVCHNGSIPTAANVSEGANDSFALASGHALDTSTSATGLTNSCSSCHQPHSTATKNPMIPAATINGKSVRSTGNVWCLACHDNSNSWYGAGYPSPSSPTRDALGYPILGTWVGQSAYEGARNAHRLVPETNHTAGSGHVISRGAGDCLYCHAAHRGSNTYDGLVGTYRPTTSATLASDKAQGDYAAACFSCHGGVTPSGFATAPADIKGFVTSGGTASGHSIVTSGGLLPVGAPLPCYECHNPHGSTRDNDSMLSDVLGGSLTTTGSASSVRQFCFTCHTTNGSAKGWDSTTATYTAVDSGAKVVGIPRTGGVLNLPAVTGHRQNDSASCYQCHGSDYAQPSGNNVHNPSIGGFDPVLHTAAPLAEVVVISGLSYGPVVCADCHDTVLNTEHDKATSSSAGVGCANCHPTPKDTLTPSWDKSCAQGGCHTVASSAPMHASIDASHAPIAGQTCYAAGCHPATGSQSLAETHRSAVATLGGSPRSSCQVCHWNGIPASGACSSCHADRVDGTHGAAQAHTFSSASDYNNTTVAGCTNSGSGCHGVETTYGSFATYHPNTGCAGGACHASPSKPTYAGNRECVSCHDGNFTNAPDVVAIAAASPNGHYNETTHTASGLSATVKGTASGTVSAACSDCHNPTGTAGMGALYNQHQALPAPYGSTTCADCHNNSLAVTTVVTTKWATRQCDACHNVSTMPTAAQHGYTAPVVNGSSSVTCADAGCHGTWNLHAIHGGKAGGVVSTCALSGCHDYTKQGTKPTATTCGVGGSCHTDKADGGHGATVSHAFTAASNYNNTTISGCTNSGVGCHNTETTYDSFAAYHPASGCMSGVCHTSPSKATYTGNHECVSCHDGSFVGAPPNTPLHAPAGLGHYSETTHTAVGLGTTVTAGGAASATCNDCHNATNLGNSDVRQLYNQHQGLPAPYANTTCYDCHNKNVYVTSVITTKWPTKRCDACHSSTVLGVGFEQHGTTAPVVAPTAVGTYQSMACNAAGCHAQGDIHAIHKDAATCALSGCHDFNLQAKLPIGASCGTGNACHTSAEPHTHLSASHDASAQPMAQPGSASQVTTAVATAENQSFATATWPTDWTRGSTTYIRSQNNAARVRSTYAAELYSASTTTRAFQFYKDIDLSNYQSATLTFWNYTAGFAGGTDFSLSEYSTNGGTTWTPISNLTASTPWTQRTVALPVGGTVRVRFGGSVNSTTEFCDWDDILITGVQQTVSTAALPTNSSALISCQNNPNGTECHVVTDTRTLHAATANKCTNCHKAGGPTNNCQTASCHSTQYINVDVHNTANHATSQISTATGQPFAGTGVPSTTCTGCHDDTISLEHGVLTAYKSTPCSMCHKKTTNSGAPTNVTSANVAAAILKAPGTALCTDCHKTVTAAAPHIQRQGSTAASGSVQFDPTWSGHKVYDTGLGSGTSFANIQGATRTWTLPTATGWLKTGWTTTNMAVRCNDCHGSVTGSIGPHGASMKVNIAAGYDNSYSAGTLALSGGSMNNTTNICAKCHTTNLNVNGDPHGRTDHNIACISCHVKTPHAWKRPRLIGYTTDPVPYRSTQVTGISAANHSPTTWTTSMCAAGCNTSTHPAITGTALWP